MCIFIHPCLIWIQHPLMMMMMIMMIIIVIVIIIILLVVQLLSLSTSSSFFCVSEYFLTGVWLFNIHFVSLGKPFIRSRPSNRPAVLLLSFIYLFVYFVNFHSILSLFFIRFLLRSVAVRRVRSNRIKWYYLATKYTSKIVTNIFAHEINVIKRRGQIKKELFFVGGVWENICVNTDISIKWQ